MMPRQSSKYIGEAVESSSLRRFQACWQFDNHLQNDVLAIDKRFDHASQSKLLFESRHAASYSEMRFAGANGSRMASSSCSVNRMT